MRVDNMLSTLEGTRHNRDKIEGQPKETAGSVVKRGLGVKYPALSYNTRMMDMRNTIGGVNDTFIKRMTESREPWQSNLLTVDPETMTPFEIEMREAHNAALTKAQEKHQDEGTVVSWGAD